MTTGDKTDDLRPHLHELAEGLQAATYFVEILRTGGPTHVDATLVEKTASQLGRAQESFRHIRTQLGEP